MTTSLNYPASLPPPLIATFEIDDMPAIARDDMDSGHARQRLRNTSLYTQMPIQFQFKNWEYMVFEAWLRWKVNYTGWFNIALQAGVGFAQHEARFKGDALPKAPLQKGNMFLVSATLEVRERPMLSNADLDLLINEDGDALLGSINAFHLYITTARLWGS